MDLKNYLDQHEAVKKEMKAIKSFMSASDLEAHTRDIALHVSTLAGKIKIHLSMEDKYLYPVLQERGSEQVKKVATAYQKEMGDLADKFESFKDKYNTNLKILQSLGTLKSDTAEIFEKIEKRIQKEEKELYRFI